MIASQIVRPALIVDGSIVIQLRSLSVLYKPAMQNRRLLDLEAAMQVKIPNAKLTRTSLPMVPDLYLMLLEDTYPQSELSPEQAAELMDNPPYWSFCWASGQVLARYLINNPQQIQNKTVIDFGCGSGVVAIAAAMAGARRVIAVDIDGCALEAARLNAELNGVHIECISNLETAADELADATLMIADVFYDAANIPLLQNFLDNYAEVIVADSRIKPQALEGVYEVARYESCTVPDLAESTDFNSVGIYRAQSGGGFRPGSITP